MRLEITDRQQIDRLAQYLSGLGLSAYVAGPTSIEVVPPHEHDADAAVKELRTYLKVWDALYPDVEVFVEVD